MAWPNYVDQERSAKMYKFVEETLCRGESINKRERDLSETSLFNRQSVDERGPNVTFGTLRYVARASELSKEAQISPHGF